MVAVVLALLKVRTTVIAARDGGGGESMAVRGVAVAASAVRGVWRTSGGASRHVERQHASGSIRAAACRALARRAMTRRPAAHRAAECLAAAAMGCGGRQRWCGGKAAVREGSGSSRRGQAVCARRVCTQGLWLATDLPYLSSSE